MPTRATILEAMQWPLFNDKNPLNTTADPRRAITYQFESSPPGDFGDFGSTYSGWTGLTRGEKRAVNKMLAHIETFLNVDFQKVSGAADPDLNIGKVNLPSGIAGEGGYGASISGNEIIRWDGFAVYDKGVNIAKGHQALILHELGHALGLKHPFSPPTLPSKVENNHYTLMSYTDDPTHSGDNKVMMLYDVLALQDIWGAAAYHTGANSYTGPRVSGVDVIWDTGGNDTLDASAHRNNVKLDLRAGHFSKFGGYEDVAIAFDVKIENAIGGRGSDKIIGNGAANSLKGGGGKDNIKGGGGSDTLAGGAGGDNLNGGGGQDVLRGGGGGDTLRGGGGNDTLRGQSGGDTFVFKTGDGADRVLDFQDDVDHVKVVGFGSKALVLSYADTGGGDVSFDFGHGDVLTIQDVTLTELRDDLFIA